MLVKSVSILNNNPKSNQKHNMKENDISFSRHLVNISKPLAIPQSAQAEWTFLDFIRKAYVTLSKTLTIKT